MHKRCAEARFAKLIADSGVSLRAVEKFLKFFEIVGKDRATLQDMGRTKLRNIIINV